MAKKKSESPVKPASSGSSKQAEPKKSEAKPAAAMASGDARAIDTSGAAHAAAAMVGNKFPAPTAAGTGAPKKESAAFKQLKAGLNKPSAGALGGAFGPIGQTKRSKAPLGGGKQVGRNQTFGADVNRAGVPRRTPG